MSRLLEINHLKKYFPIRGGLLNRRVADFRAVDDVSFTLQEGKTLGLVGESGSGKTTIGKCILRLLEPTSGQILYDGQDITHIKARELRRLRSEIQMIYQAPAASLNGRMTVGQIIGEPLVDPRKAARGRGARPRAGTDDRGWLERKSTTTAIRTNSAAGNNSALASLARWLCSRA